MRDITQLHPTLQAKVYELIDACAKKGITIGIGECVRTVKEQDNLYAQGRTKPGNKVTNAKGSNYSSMHQWGVAFDFYLKMDIDGDGKTSDDAFNNATKMFNKVGEIGKSLGLEWGGNWTSIKDLPHFQLPNWGSTATALKNKYKNPDAFKKTWVDIPKPTKSTSSAKKETTSSSSSSSTTKTTSKNYSKTLVTAATKKNKTFTGNYKVSANLNLRAKPDAKKGDILITIPKGEIVSCYGYYSTDSSGATWYYVQYGKYTGHVKASYCQKTK